MIKPATRVGLARMLQQLQSEAKDNKENLQELATLFRKEASRFESMIADIPTYESKKTYR